MDKALVTLHRQPLLGHALRRLAPQVERLALSAAGDPARFAAFNVPVLDDGEYRGMGPLAGVLAGLRWAARMGGEALLTVPVDTPFIPYDLAAFLDAAPAVACHAGRVHHLVALWPVAAEQALAEFLAEPGSRRVAEFARLLAMRPVEFLDAECPGADPFANINTPADLAAAEARLI